MLMRVGSDGSSSKMDVKDWESKFMDQSSESETANCPPVGYCNITTSFSESVSTVGAVPASPLPLQMITNADQGTLLSWEADTPAYCASATSNAQGVPPTCTSQVAAASTFAVATTKGTSASTPFSVNIPRQSTPLYPVLQTQDGSYAGYVGIGPSPGVATQYNMVAFNRSGSTIWSVPNDYPQIATEDGGVIGSSGITYDSQGRATGQGALPGTPSWQGFMYSVAGDPVAERTVPPTNFLNADLMQIAGGNVGGTGTAAIAAFPFLDDPYSLRLVPRFDNGKQNNNNQNFVREIDYCVTRMDGKSKPKWQPGWYVTEHQTNQGLAGPNGMSSTDKPNEFDDTIGCQTLGWCSITQSSQTFTISPRKGECAYPSYGNGNPSIPPLNPSPCNTNGGNIIVHTNVTVNPDYAELGIWFNTDNVLVNGLYAWPDAYGGCQQ